MHLIQSLKNEFCFDLPMFSKYPATSINSYFYKVTLEINGNKTKSNRYNITFQWLQTEQWLNPILIYGVSF